MAWVTAEMFVNQITQWPAMEPWLQATASLQKNEILRKNKDFLEKTRLERQLVGIPTWHAPKQ